MSRLPRIAATGLALGLMAGAAGAATSHGTCQLSRDCNETTAIAACPDEAVTLDWRFDTDPQIILDGAPHRAERIAGGALEITATATEPAPDTETDTETEPASDTASDTATNIGPGSLIQFWADAQRGSLTPGPGGSVTLIRVTLAATADAPETTATATASATATATAEADMADLAAATRLYSGTCEGLF